jgi:hypothetical protein
VFVAGRALEFGVESRILEDDAGEVEPGDRGAAAEVEDTGGIAVEEVDGSGGEERGVGRGGDEVLDDADGLSGAGEAEHGFDEVAAVGGAAGRTEDARGTEDEGAVEVGLGVEFAGEFGDGVGAEGVGGVGLDVGAAEGAVEDVVGGVVDEAGVDLAAGDGEVADGEGVGHEGGLGFAFGDVDLIVGGGVEDDLGVKGGEGLFDGDGVGYIDLAAFVAPDFVAAFAEFGAEFLAELSAATEYYCFWVHSTNITGSHTLGRK